MNKEDIIFKVLVIFLMIDILLLSIIGISFILNKTGIL